MLADQSQGLLAIPRRKVSSQSQSLCCTGCYSCSESQPRKSKTDYPQKDWVFVVSLSLHYMWNYKVLSKLRKGCRFFNSFIISANGTPRSWMVWQCWPTSLQRLAHLDPFCYGELWLLRRYLMLTVLNGKMSHKPGSTETNQNWESRLYIFHIRWNRDGLTLWWIWGMCVFCRRMVGFRTKASDEPLWR